MTLLAALTQHAPGKAQGSINRLATTAHSAGSCDRDPPTGVAAAVADPVNIADIATVGGLRDACDSGYQCWCQQQMDVICRQYVGVYRDLVFAGRCAEAAQVAAVVLFGAEADLAVVAAE